MSYKENYYKYSLQYVYDPATEEWIPQTSDSAGNSVVVIKDNEDYGDIQRDAWGRPKSIRDFSLFHALFTFSVRNAIWEESSISGGVWTPLAATGTRATSVGGKLQVASGTTASQGAVLTSRSHPRYQPNRGHLYSSAAFLPSPTADGRRMWGLFTKNNGVYFELEGTGSSWTLYACRKSDGSVELRQDLSDYLPEGFDPSKGHVYDIQFQWRGVGNYYFYIDQALIYSEINLGARTDLSIRNPAMPVAFLAETDTTTEIYIQVGCVDVTTEGGKKEGRNFLSIATDGLVNVDNDATGNAVLAIKIPRTVTKGSEVLENTINVVASKATSWCRDESAIKAYIARDIAVTNLNGLTWLALADSTVQYLVGGDGSLLDTAFQTDASSMQLLFEEWTDAEVKNVVDNPSAEDAPFVLTPGDILVISVEALTVNNDCAATLYLAEEL